jgi:uncharacterized membrane protein YraQ (UPF0718 family)
MQDVLTRPRAPMREANPARKGLAATWKRADKALLSIALAIAIAFLISPRQAGASLIGGGKSLLKLSPYLLIAYAASGYMKAAGVDFLVTRVFRGRTVTMIMAATLLGSFSPFCSCTVVPVIAVLLRSGIPLPAIFAFWIASPLMSPDIYVLTAGTVGVGFANARLLSTVFVGLFAGLATLALTRIGLLKTPLSSALASEGMLDISGPGQFIKPVWKFWREPERVAAFKTTFWHTAFLLTKWMAFAFFLESLMEAWIPEATVRAWMGSSNAFAIPLAVLIGVPTYLNALVAIPFLKGLLATGVAPGAVLAFTVGGGITSIPAMLAVAPMVRKGVFGWYLTLAFVGALLSGYAYAWVLTVIH